MTSALRVPLKSPVLNATMGEAGGSGSALMCTICINTLADPFVTPCGHTYCYTCIAKV